MPLSKLQALRLLRATSTRLALLNGAAFAFGFAVLLVLMVWLADRFMTDQLAESLDAEMQILVADMEIDGPEALRLLLGLRLAEQRSNHVRIYRLEPADGQGAIGNLPQWPQHAPAAGRNFELDSLHHPGQTQVLARWEQLSDGSRLLVGFDEIELREVRRKLRQAALYGFSALLLVSLIGGVLLTRAALRPVEAIRRSAERIMRGELDHRIPLRNTGDEIDRLGETLNAMLDEISRLITAVQGATDSIAHDLRSPLTRHRARLEVARGTSPPSLSQWPGWIQQNLDDIDHVLETFQALLRIASIDSGALRSAFESFDLVPLLRDAGEFVEPLLEERKLELQLQLPPRLLIHGHRHLLFQVVLNLLDNAIKYIPEGSRIRIAANATAQGIALSVCDNGPGIAAEDREKVFSRHYRGDPARHSTGLGLGLSLVRSVATLHLGSVCITDAGPGTCVTLSLPLFPRE